MKRKHVQQGVGEGAGDRATRAAAAAAATTTKAATAATVVATVTTAAAAARVASEMQAASKCHEDGRACCT